MSGVRFPSGSLKDVRFFLHLFFSSKYGIIYVRYLDEEGTIMKQIIISVGREFGSGGHIVAQKIAEHYDIPIFNKELLEEMARKEGYSEKALEKYDEKPVNFGFMPLPYAGGNIPIEQEIAMKQFEFIKNKADAGESFVIVGRCADEILAYNPNLVSVFYNR